MNVPKNCKYSQKHEWVRVEGDEGVIGVSDYAQEQLSDVVYVELPEVGDSFQVGDVLAVIESVKAASDVYMPIAGEVLEVNEALEDSPELVNQDPYGEAWLVRIAFADLAELDTLMEVDAYQTYVEGLDE